MDTWLLMVLHLTVPPAEPPMFPAALVPEHPEQATDEAPELNVALSPS